MWEVYEFLAQLTDFGKQVKIRLVEMDKSQTWLREQISNETGLYCDSSRLAKFLSGAKPSPTIEGAIQRLLFQSDGG